MLSRLIQDLRFVIGLFFAIVGGLLLAVGITNQAPYPDGLRLNLWAGSLMAIFATLMILLSVLVPTDEPMG